MILNQNSHLHFVQERTYVGNKKIQDSIMFLDSLHVTFHAELSEENSFIKNNFKVVYRN